LGTLLANVMTKCIRVGISDTTKEVVDVLIEKFRPDMKMLTRNSYALHEVHVNGGWLRLGNKISPHHGILNSVRKQNISIRNHFKHISIQAFQKQIIFSNSYYINSYALYEVHVNGGNEIKIKKHNDNDSARHRSQDICQPIFQIVLKNLIKIRLFIVIIKE
jgi:hypothetical protein